jgi:hypothetical protein
MSLELGKIVEIVINDVNYIKTRPLKARMFDGLCKDSGAG